MITAIRNSSRPNNQKESIEIVKDKNKKLIIERLYKGNSLKPSQLKFNHKQNCIQQKYMSFKVDLSGSYNLNNSPKLIPSQRPYQQQKDRILQFFQQFDSRSKVKYAPINKIQENQNLKLHRSLLKQLYDLTNHHQNQENKKQLKVFQYNGSNTQNQNNFRYHLDELLQTAQFHQPSIDQDSYNKFKTMNQIPQINLPKSINTTTQVNQQINLNKQNNVRINSYGFIKRSKTQFSILEKKEQRPSLDQYQQNKHKCHSIKLFNNKRDQNNGRSSISQLKNVIPFSNREYQDQRIYHHSNSHRYLRQLSRFKTQTSRQQRQVKANYPLKYSKNTQKDQNIGSHRINDNKQSSSEQKLKLIRRQLHQIYRNKENQFCLNQQSNYSKNPHYLQANKINKTNQNFNYSHRLLLNRSNNYHHQR